MIKVRFFAMLRERAGVETKQYAPNGPVTLKELKEMVKRDFPALSDILDDRSLLVSVNEELARDDAVIKEGDEVAFMPPFSGG